MNFCITAGMFVLCILCMRVCMFMVSNALLMSRLTMTVLDGGLFSLNPWMMFPLFRGLLWLLSVFA